jgi:hypothetical protein
VKANHYFQGEVYSSKWILDSIKHGKLQDNDKYLVSYVGSEGSRRLELDAGTYYTIRESFKMYEICRKNGKKVKNKSFWSEIERESIIPGRTMEGLRNFVYKYFLQFTWKEFYE